MPRPVAALLSSLPAGIHTYDKGGTLRRHLYGLAAVVLLLTLAPQPAAHAVPPIPSSMASLGDSITRGFNANGWFVDHPSRSFSTGDNSTVNSHYLRIKSKNSAITGKNFNYATSGAEMIDLNAQVQNAVNAGVQYVTIELGANDVCASTEAGMTPVATYRSQLDQALATLKAGLPNAAVAVISIPSVYRLWDIGKNSSSARSAWSGYNICQSMLANPQSTAQADVDRRNRVRQRNIDFNTQLEQACTAYGANCDFDGNAVFNYPFALSHMSSWDYFHPNTSGQAVLAQQSYANGFNW
ncbi:MAG TPA: SGNH/GDSL hydrolase family protein [Acidimicrobiales bacterium]|nr:SGNH/GDSL hydrolase family protein [Acidimicrobiales bacterium]